MYNHYKGNSGKVIRVEDRETPAPKKMQPRKPQHNVSKPAMPLLDGSLSKLIPKSLNELETEDLLLILILYLMYRESGDRELLIIMGAMYLL